MTGLCYFEAIGSESGYQAGLVYSFNNAVSMTFDYKTIDDVKIISLGARINL